MCRRVIAASVLLALWVDATAGAQSVDVTVNGVVRDHTGAMLPGATVTATNVETKLIRSSTTDGAGLYNLSPLPVGLYEIRADHAGFQTNIRANQTLHVGMTVTIDFTLDVLTSADAVEVVARAPVLETSKNTLSRLVTKEEIDTLPVIDRNFNSLAALVPGVTATGAYGGVDISGSRDFQNGYNVDGVSAEGLSFGEQRIRFAQDWVHEFQVLTNQYNVEFGRASGGIVNATTRSGTNLLRARVYGFFRNDGWDATPAFTGTKVPLDIKRLGGTVGGKVVRNRLFYFMGSEWFDNASSSIVNSAFPAENRSVPFTTREALYLAKADYHPNRSSTYRLRFNGQRARSTGVGIGGVFTEEYGLSTSFDGYDVTASATHVMSSAVFNEVRAAFNDIRRNSQCNFAQRHLPGTWFERLYPGGRFGCPIQTFGGSHLVEMQILDNVSWTRGVHNFKAGVDVSRAGSSGNLRNAGTYRFSRDIPFSLENPASFPDFFAIVIGPADWDYSWWSWGGFAQDSWQLRPNLTLNVGVRYDVDGGYTALNAMVRTELGLTKFGTDRNNVSPRAGMAWTPLGNDRRFLVRGGAGLYYDQTHANVATLLLQVNLLAERQVTISANEPGLNPFWPDIAGALRFLAEGLARNSIPDIGSLRSASGALNVEENLQIPATFQASIGAAQDFGTGLSASADLVYSRGVDQYLIRDVNIDEETARGKGQIVRLNPNYSFINTYGNGGRFTYGALQLQASFAPRPDHFAKLSYTLATNVGNTSTILSGNFGVQGGAGATNPFDFDEDKGPSDNDVRHALSINGTSTLPLGFGLSAVMTYRSPLPFSVTSPFQLDSDPFRDRPEPRNSRRGDSYFSLDARLAKVVRFTQRRFVTGFVEVFNVTNATNLISYVGTVGSSLFAQPTGALEKRRTQIGFRVDF